LFFLYLALLLSFSFLKRRKREPWRRNRRTPLPPPRASLPQLLHGNRLLAPIVMPLPPPSGNTSISFSRFCSTVSQSRFCSISNFN
jgi:hypothetical protein